MTDTSWAKWLTSGRRYAMVGSASAMAMLLVVLGFILHSQYQTTGHNLDRQAQNLADVLQSTTPGLLASADTASLTALRQRLKSDWLDTVNFRNNEGQPLIPEETLGEQNHERIELTVKDSAGASAGKLELLYNKKGQWALFLQNASLLLFGGFFVLMAQLVLFVFSWWINRRIVDSLVELVKRLRNSANLTYEKAFHVKQASETVDTQSQSQAAASQETVSALTEISAMMATSLNHVENSTEAAVECHQLAHRGKISVDNVIEAVQKISQANSEVFSQVQQSNRRIQDLVTMIRDISQKTNVINEIVFQTKLLSFNASVEAARAGEHGRGFAIVAEEVGNLASMSGQAAAEIDRLLNASVARTEAIVAEATDRLSQAFSSGTTATEHGVTLARECGQVLDELVRQVESLKLKMSEIRRASQEQTNGVTNINIAIDKIDENTRVNAENSRAVGQDSEMLVKEADNLSALVREMESSLYGRQQDAIEPAA